VAGAVTAAPVNAYWLAHASDRVRLERIAVTPSLKGAASLLPLARRHAEIPEIAALAVILDEIVRLDAALNRVRRVVPGEDLLRSSLRKRTKNEGTCPVCMKRQKLTLARRMVHHGFAITDDAGQALTFRVGKCLGTGFPAFELSKEGAGVYRSALMARKRSAEERLRALQAGEVKSITHRGQVKVHGAYVSTAVTTSSDHFMFPTLIDLEIRSVQGQIDELRREIEHQEFRIKNWQRQPLPEERQEHGRSVGNGVPVSQVPGRAAS
jgi:hypothetical protein